MDAGRGRKSMIEAVNATIMVKCLKCFKWRTMMNGCRKVTIKTGDVIKTFNNLT